MVRSGSSRKLVFLAIWTFNSNPAQRFLVVEEAGAAGFILGTG
jgi:hypothetical protein